MRSRGLGVDIQRLNRFDSFKKNKGSRFLTNNYSQEELAYCFSFKDPRPHLAGTFAAKEAVFKALERDGVSLSSIEIKRNKNGRPTVWMNKRRQKSIIVSMSHVAKIAVAVAIKQ